MNALAITLVLTVGLAESAKYSSRELQKLYRQKKSEYHMDGFRSTGDEKDHFKSFCEFANMVKEHNEEDGEEWQGEINMFAMMTKAERELWHGVNITAITSSDTLDFTERADAETDLNLEERGETVDYTKKLPPVKNQGSCGSCWTFGAVAALEYQVNRKSKTIKTLSEQQYLDCVYEGKRDGCQGGWPSLCYEWTKNNNNLIASQKDYPYVARDGACKKNVRTAIKGFQVRGTTNLAKGDNSMFAAVKDPSKGVMSCAIGVPNSFHSYRSGVFSASNCDKIAHAVDVVGYGTLNGNPYWNVRNSWGPNWGDRGYIKMKRGPNTCAIASYAHFPVVSGSGDGDDKDDNDDKDDRKKTCKWKKVQKRKLKGRLTGLQYSKSDAMKRCEKEKSCEGISCKMDKKCMLNKSGKGKSNGKFTGYLCL